MQDVQRLRSAEELDASEEPTRVPVDATLQVLYPINDYEMYKIICRRLLSVVFRLFKALANAISAGVLAGNETTACADYQHGILFAFAELVGHVSSRACCCSRRCYFS